MDIVALDELWAGHKPGISPYERILEDYIEAWIEDIAAALLGSRARLFRSHRYEALGLCLAGMMGEYEDSLLSLAAQQLRVHPEQLWRQLFCTAYKKAKSVYEQSGNN